MASGQEIQIEDLSPEMLNLSSQQSEDTDKWQSFLQHWAEKRPVDGDSSIAKEAIP